MVEQLLKAYGFDEATFKKLQNLVKETIATGEAIESINAVQGEVSPISSSQYVDIQAIESDIQLDNLGIQAVKEGRIAVAILAGGMATRFGGGVKALAEVYEGLSFLELKLRSIEALAERVGKKIPVFIMTSFATHQAINEVLAQRRSSWLSIETFAQGISIRLTKEGEIFYDDHNEPSLYAPGHGDFPFYLKRSGILDRFKESGGTCVFLSNVDNLGATTEPSLIGAHMNSAKSISAEIVDTLAGDKGGAPMLVDGVPQILEAFRFPPHIDAAQMPVFSINSIYIDLDALESPGPLSWFVASKKILDRPCLQFERLVGQLTAFHSTGFIHVPRTGIESRFEPVKDVPELERRKENIKALLHSRMGAP